MSSDLEGAISSFDDTKIEVARPTARIKLGELGDNFRILSVEMDKESSGINVCLDPGARYDRLLQALLDEEDLNVEIVGKTFISKIFKLELDRAYLSLTR